MIDPNKSHMIVTKFQTGGGIQETADIPTNKEFLCTLDEYTEYSKIGWETGHLPECEDCRRQAGDV